MLFLFLHKNSLSALLEPILYWVGLANPSVALFPGLGTLQSPSQQQFED